MPYHTTQPNASSVVGKIKAAGFAAALGMKNRVQTSASRNLQYASAARQKEAAKILGAAKMRKGIRH